MGTSCQVRTAVCLFAWDVGRGPREGEVRQGSTGNSASSGGRKKEKENSVSSSIICQFSSSEWISRWNSYYNAVFTYFSLIFLLFYPLRWQSSNSTVSPWCNYFFGNSTYLWRMCSGTEHLQAYYKYRWAKLTNYLEADKSCSLAVVWFTLLLPM